MPLLHCCSTNGLPSSCSCKVQTTDVSRRTMLVEMMFGVQLGYSDIF